MSTFSRTSTFIKLHRTRCCSLPHLRTISTSTGEYDSPFSTLKSPTTFEGAGLRPALAKALYTAFPNVKIPTKIQSTLISNTLISKDIILQNETGSGKSFGLILALLNKPRLSNNLDSLPITSLLLVPHKDLAFQMLHWVERITQASAVNPPPLASIAQVIVRDGRRNLTESLSSIRDERPHLLIGTPASVLEISREDPNALNFQELSTVALDEVDYMIETLPLKNDGNYEYQKKMRRMEKHPGPARLLLDQIYAKPTTEDRGAVVDRPNHRPQLILSSATIRRQLKNYFFSEKQYLNSSVVKIRGAVMRLHGRDELATTELAIRSLISHHVLVTSDEGITNLPTAVAAQEDNDPPTLPSDDPNNEGSEHIPSTAVVDEVAESRSIEFSMTPSPLNQNSLEAVAAVFALGVPAIALLVIPSSASVHRAVYDLKEMGVSAYGLDLLTQKGGRSHLLHAYTEQTKANPTLFVCTPSSTRGLDLPSLTHIFILGFECLIAQDWTSTLDTYIHLCGRTGRFGKHGKVVTVIEKKSVPSVEKVLSTLRVVPVKLKMFE